MLARFVTHTAPPVTRSARHEEFAVAMTALARLRRTTAPSITDGPAGR